MKGMPTGCWPLYIVLLAIVALAGCGQDAEQQPPASSFPLGTSPQRATQGPGERVPQPFPGKGRVPFLPPGDPQPPSSEPQFAGSGGGFVAPIRIQQTPGGWLLVSDSKRGAVLRVHPETLQPDQSLPVQGTPLGIGMLGDELFIGLRERRAIEVRSRTGEPKGFLAAPGTIGEPSDLAPDEGRGLLFALDGLAREVKVFRAADRTLLGAIGAGELLAPSGIAVDPARSELLVSDYGSSSQSAAVHIFSYAAESFGTLAATLSGAGQCNFMGCSGGFSRPRGLAARNGQIYLPDAIYGQVLVYRRDTLALVTRLGTADPAARELRLPSDAVAGEGGDLFVTSTQSRAVVAFRGSAP